MASRPGTSGTSSQPDSVGNGRASSSFMDAEAGPSRAFTDSTVRRSKSAIETPPSGTRKISFRKLSIEAVSDIPLNDDRNELIEEKERSVAEIEKSANKSLAKSEEEQDVSIVKTMTMQQMQEHVSRCLQLSTENKINTKNAFALKLIDCMTIITKNDDKSNFAAMACQLDAGAKIYSSRVDAVHQQVMKLADTCTFAEKKKKDTEDNEGRDDDEGEAEGEVGAKEKEKKKKPRKKVLATKDQITRQPKENNPKDMFVSLEALPGDILNKAKYSPEDLSLTLDKHKPFWMDWQNYKPTVPEGECEIPEIDIKNRQLRPKDEGDLKVDWSSISKLELEPLPCPKSPTEPVEHMDDDEDCSDTGDVEEDDNEEDSQENTDLDVISMARSRMTTEGSGVPSTSEVIRTVLHDPGESEYHYLKMENSNFWAGPAYWKRPQGKNFAENRKKAIRKKREPVEVRYSDVENSENPFAQSCSGDRISTSNKKTSTLSKRTMAKWSSKKVTYPQDIHFEPETFHMLFNTNIVAAVVFEDLEKQQSNEGDEDTVELGEDHVSRDFSEDDARSESSPPFRGFPSPGHSSLEDEPDFRGFPSPGGSSPFDPEHGFKGFGSQESDMQEEYTIPTTDCDKGGLPRSSCDVYEGENLVPMVKTVKVDPIRIVAKPNRVDMQHLKEVMLQIIRRFIEDRENQQRDEGRVNSQASVAFKEVLTNLFSSDELHARTREDLTVQMAFLCLLTLTNENSFQLKTDDTGDFLIMYDSNEGHANI